MPVIALMQRWWLAVALCAIFAATIGGLAGISAAFPDVAWAAWLWPLLLLGVIGCTRLIGALFGPPPRTSQKWRDHLRTHGGR